MSSRIRHLIVAAALVVPGVWIALLGADALAAYCQIRDHDLPRAVHRLDRATATYAAVSQAGIPHDLDPAVVELDRATIDQRLTLDGLAIERTDARVRLLAGGAVILLGIGFGLFGLQMRASDRPANVGGSGVAPANPDPGLA